MGAPELSVNMLEVVVGAVPREPLLGMPLIQSLKVRLVCSGAGPLGCTREYDQPLARDEKKAVKAGSLGCSRNDTVSHWREMKQKQ